MFAGKDFLKLQNVLQLNLCGGSERELAMLTPDELMDRLAGDNAIRQIARHFDLTRDQTIAAIGALMPAFLAALKRNPAKAASSPFGQFGSGTRYAPPDDWSRAFSPEAMARGNAILGQLFGSKEVSRAIAEHATHVSQINADTLKRLLPVLAPILMGEFDRPRETVQQPTANPLAEMFETMFAGMSGQAQQGTPAPAERNPFAAMYEEFFRAMRVAPDASRQEPPRKDLFDAGLKMQKEYFDGIESILEKFLPREQK